MKEILKQFGPELVPDYHDFPVGYARGGNNVWISMATDVQDVWSFVHGCESVALWCHGVSTNSKNKCQKDFSSESDSDSDDPKYKKERKKKKRKRSAFEEKADKVEWLVTKLRQKHGS